MTVPEDKIMGGVRTVDEHKWIRQTDASYRCKRCTVVTHDPETYGFRCSRNSPSETKTELRARARKRNRRAD